jgi:transcriptional regulator with XRE-family HTH domain
MKLSYDKLPPNRELARLVRKIRESRSITQSQLALMARVSLRTIQRLEKEGRASKETMLSISSALEIDIERLPRKENTTLRPNLILISLAFSAVVIISAAFINYLFQNQQIGNDAYHKTIKWLTGIISISLTLLTVFLIKTAPNRISACTFFLLELILIFISLLLLPDFKFGAETYKAVAVLIFNWLPVMLLIYLLTTILINQYSKFITGSEQKISIN